MSGPGVDGRVGLPVAAEPRTVAPLRTVALTGNFSVPTSTVASGLATRLWYQAGLFGAPPIDATIR